MLHLFDPAHGESVAVRPSAPRLLRVRCGPGIRSALTADLARRVAERHGWRAAIDRDASPGLTDRQLLELNVHPATGPLPGEHADLTLHAVDEPSLAAMISAASAAGVDPLAVRLALMGHHYRSRAGIDLGEVTAADAELQRLRALVAEDAEAPSAPPATEAARDVLDALDDDLDTAAALTGLRRLVTGAGLGAGARFETLAHLDRVLGLDLARDVGRSAR